MVIQGQNVPFKNSYVTLEAGGDVFTTSKQEGVFPLFENEYKFQDIEKKGNIEVALIDDTNGDNMKADLKVQEFVDQKLHEKWVMLKKPNENKNTDVKIRMVIHYLFSKQVLCEEAILGWEHHLNKLK